MQVRATGGVLLSVLVRAADGTALGGELDAPAGTWRSTGRMVHSTRYTVTAVAMNTAGRRTTTTTRFATLTPADTVSATLTPGDGWTVGVGMPIVLSFSRSIPPAQRAKVQKGLRVQAKPAVTGAWRWMSDSELQWRPKAYWPSGTRVRVTSELGGTEFTRGVWGSRNLDSGFTIGSAVVSTVDISAHTLSVRRNGTLIRVIPVTTGKPGFLTRNGIKVIMSRDQRVIMDAATTGIPKDSPNYYRLPVYWTMRLTYSGEFLHAAPWSAYAQGRANVSHGCTGMSTGDAQWMFHQSKVGDVVVFINGSRPLEWGNGWTAWNRPFSAWAAGSA